MSASKFALVLALALVVGSLTAHPAAAQTPQPWLPYASGFAGGSVIPAFGVTLEDPATASRLAVKDRKLLSAATFGGSLGIWKKAERSRFVWGLRGEVSRQRADADQQMLLADGTLFGQAYRGPIPVPSADGSATLVAGTLLIGRQIGGPGPSGFGRVTLYAGAGGGLNRTSAMFAGQGESKDTSGAFQALGGVLVGAGRRVSAFAEYRHLRVKHQLVIGTQTVDFSVRPNQVVAGFIVKLF